MARLSERWSHLREALLKPLDPALQRRRTHPAYLLRLALQIGRKWAADRSPQQAGMLAFQSTLSLVPLIGVGFALLNATKMLGAQSALIDFLSEHVLPVRGEEVIGRLVKFSNNISAGAVGLLGLTSAVALAYMMFHSVEKIFNDIWKVRERRSLVGKLTVFYPLATLSPLLMGLTLYYTTRFWRAPGLLGLLAPMTSTFVGFTLANKLLPKTRVSWRAAMAGAITAAILFELSKHGFQAYVDRVAFSSFRGIYGALGLVPLLLIWIYYSWLVVLFGAEVGYTVQNLPAIEEAERSRLRASVEAEETERRINGRVAARLLLAVANNFAQGRKAMPQEDIVRRFRLPSDVVDRIFSRLKEHDLAVEIYGEVAGYMPARPLDEIHLQEVLDLFEGADLEPARRDEDLPADRLTLVQSALASAKEKILSEVTFADLVRDHRDNNMLGERKDAP